MWHVRGRDTYRVLVGKPGGRRSHGRPGHRWVDNIKIDLKVIRSWVWTGFFWLRIGTGVGLF
jgi:hypothetical protein